MMTMKCEACAKCAGSCPVPERGPLALAVLVARGGISQTAFASRLGVTQPTIAALELGKRKPSPRLAYRLARLSGQPVEVFMEEHYARTG